LNGATGLPGLNGRLLTGLSRLYWRSRLSLRRALLLFGQRWLVWLVAGGEAKQQKYRW
jgi:hypothetical protein